MICQATDSVRDSWTAWAGGGAQGTEPLSFAQHTDGGYVRKLEEGNHWKRLVSSLVGRLETSLVQYAESLTWSSQTEARSTPVLGRWREFP